MLHILTLLWATGLTSPNVIMNLVLKRCVTYEPKFLRIRYKTLYFTYCYSALYRNKYWMENSKEGGQWVDHDRDGTTPGVTPR